MAISSSLSSSAALFPLCNSSISSKPKIPPTSSFSFLPNASSKQQQMLLPHRLSTPSTTRLFAAPELLDSTAPVEVSGEEALAFYDPNAPEVEGMEFPDWDEFGPNLKIRIKLKSYFVPRIEEACKKITDACKSTNAKICGPVPLPTKKRVYCVLKSPHVHKDARFQFEIRTHSRLIDIIYPTANTIDALLLLELPIGVNVQIKY